MNESVNYKGLCRTAPATPGLLNIAQTQCFCYNKYFVVAGIMDIQSGKSNVNRNYQKQFQKHIDHLYIGPDQSFLNKKIKIKKGGGGEGGRGGGGGGEGGGKGDKRGGEGGGGGGGGGGEGWILFLLKTSAQADNDIVFTIQFTMYNCRWIVHSVQCIVYSLLCTAYSLQCSVYCVRLTVYSPQCTANSVQFTVYSLQCTVYSVQLTAYSLQCTAYRGHFTVYSLQETAYSVHCTLYRPDHALCVELVQYRPPPLARPLGGGEGANCLA